MVRTPLDSACRVRSLHNFLDSALSPYCTNRSLACECPSSVKPHSINGCVQSLFSPCNRHPDECTLLEA